MALPEIQITTVLAIGADVEPALAGAKNRRLAGFAIRESAAAAAVGRLLHGATVTAGRQFYAATYAASARDSMWFGEKGLGIPNGVSVDWVSGAFDLTLVWFDDPTALNK